MFTGECYVIRRFAGQNSDCRRVMLISLSPLDGSEVSLKVECSDLSDAR